MRAGADSPWFYHYFKEKRPLELNKGAIAVFSFDASSNPGAVAAYLHGAGLRGFAHRPFGAGWTLFERRDASGTAKLAGHPGPPPSVLELIEDIARRPDNPYFLSPVFLSGPEGLAIVPPDVLVRFNADIPLGEAELLIRSVGGSSCQHDWGGMKNAFTVDPKTRSGIAALAMANRLAEMPEVRWAEPGFIVSAEPSCSPLSPNPPVDPSYGLSWGLEQPNDVDLDAQAAWAVCAGDPAIKVAIIDDGVDLAHEDLNVVQGMDCTSTTPFFCDNPTPCTPGGGPTDPSHKHGTTVAGVVAELANGSPARGSLGIAPKVSLISLRAQEPSTLDARAIVNALAWAEDNGVRVTNYSWNCTCEPAGIYSACLAEKYFETRVGGMVHFVSAGNGDEDRVYWPGRLPDVNAVSAVDSQGNRWVDSVIAGFGSNYGPEVKFAGPGGGIFTTDRMGSAGFDPGSNYAIRSGTSYAAPFAAGVAALALSVNPGLSAYAVEEVLCKSATDLGAAGDDIIYGCGLVNAAAAINLALATVFIDGFESGTTVWWSGVSP